MTLTDRSMEWLNQNRKRAYPCVRDEWRSLDVTAANHSLDSVLLDALVFDAESGLSKDLSIESVSVTPDKTVVEFNYGEYGFAAEFTGGSESGETSFECKTGKIDADGTSPVSLSLTFSSHAYLLDVLGEGEWRIGCRILPTRVLRMTDGAGVSRLSTNGSSKVDGHEEATDVTGDVVLEDGYRTSPIILNNKLNVRVGTRYGYDPCNYDFGDAGSRDCSVPLFFFCGQNAINSGNVVLSGGRGINVSQGGTYTIDDKASKCDGMTIPCVEIVAGRELLDLAGV